MKVIAIDVRDWVCLCVCVNVYVCVNACEGLTQVAGNKNRNIDKTDMANNGDNTHHRDENDMERRNCQRRC